MSRDLRRRIAEPSCREAVGVVTHGMEVFGLTKGDFSQLDILSHVLDATGPAHLALATWTVGADDTARIESWLESGRVLSVRIVVDFSYVRRQAAYAANMVRAFGKEAIRVTINHAKFATLTNAGWSFALRSSMNLNECRRVEFFELSESPALTKYLVDFVDQMFLAPAGYGESRLAEAMDFEQLGLDQLDPEELRARGISTLAQHPAAGGEGISRPVPKTLALDLQRSGWSSAAGKLK